MVNPHNRIGKILVVGRFLVGRWYRVFGCFVCLRDKGA